jgi:hypothetical protein
MDASERSEYSLFEHKKRRALKCSYKNQKGRNSALPYQTQCQNQHQLASPV